MSDVDIVCNETARLVEAARMTPLDDTIKGKAFSISLLLGCEYFYGSEQLLKTGNLIAGSCSLRAGFENMVDILYMRKGEKSERYANKYVNSESKFLMAAKQVKAIGLDQAAIERTFRQANKWTGATIEQRIAEVGSGAIVSYDFMCYFSHPNPISSAYIKKSSLREGQIASNRLQNCVNILFVLLIGNSHFTKNRDRIVSDAFKLLNKSGVDLKK